MINLKKNRKYIAATSAVMLALMLTMSACNDPDNENGNGNASATPEATDNQTEVLPSDSGIMDPGGLSTDNESDGESHSNNGENNKEEDTETQPADVMTGEGVYTGQIDPSSIEIKVNGEAQPFRYNTALSAVINQLPTDAKVTFSYTEKVIDSESNLKQLWLTKIEEAK
ncbi:hypothetical protein [Paenibacillus sp. HB172176]|uniref:hypothetical protein n=1 Tax=Paenibacillus sp. HB172176 TaxID=2493690 RepID=UPI00143B55C7|nr:hypothetical protein [Paenibacillus sp. HB172176]